MVGIALVIIGCGIVEGSWMNGSSIIWSLAGFILAIAGLYLTFGKEDGNEKI